MQHILVRRVYRVPSSSFTNQYPFWVIINFGMSLVSLSMILLISCLLWCIFKDNIPLLFSTENNSGVTFRCFVTRPLYFMAILCNAVTPHLIVYLIWVTYIYHFPSRLYLHRIVSTSSPQFYTVCHCKFLTNCFFSFFPSIPANLLTTLSPLVVARMEFTRSRSYSTDSGLRFILIIIQYAVVKMNSDVSTLAM